LRLIRCSYCLISSALVFLCLSTGAIADEDLSTLDKTKGLITESYQSVKSTALEKYQDMRIPFHGNFDDVYEKTFIENYGAELTIAGSAVVAGTIAYFTAGSGLATIGPLSKWIGTMVGYAAGVGSGATSAGLAILGGGSIASGGLGMAGGVAVIAAVSDIGIGIALASLENATEYDNNKYSIIKLPLPTNANPEMLAYFERLEELEIELMEDERSYEEFIAQSNTILDKALLRLYYIDPESNSAGHDFIAKAILLYNQYKYDEAKVELANAKNLIQKKDHGAFIDYMEGLIYLTEAEFDSGIRSFNAAIKKEPSAYQPYIMAALVHNDLGDYKASYKVAKKGADALPNNYQLSWITANSAFKLEDYDMAIEYYENALGNVSDNRLEAQCKIMISRAYAMKGEEYEKERKEWFKSAIEEVSEEPALVKEILELWEKEHG